MREREKILNSFDAGESNGVLDAVAPELTLEVLLDIRDLLQRSNNCPDCCYVTHGGKPSEERLRLQQ